MQLTLPRLKSVKKGSIPGPDGGNPLSNGIEVRMYKVNVQKV